MCPQKILYSAPGSEIFYDTLEECVHNAISKFDQAHLPKYVIIQKFIAVTPILDMTPWLIDLYETLHDQYDRPGSPSPSIPPEVKQKATELGNLICSLYTASTCVPTSTCYRITVSIWVSGDITAYSVYDAASDQEGL